MITIIAGTNRKNSETARFAGHYEEVLKQKTTEPVHLLDLSEIEHDWFHADMYDDTRQSESLVELQDTYMIPAQKFIFLTSEYNGSFPGVVKLFLDACSVRAYKETFFGKKAALVGIAAGRAGNLRGMDHLSDILNHVGTIVFPNKLPISSIQNLLDENHHLTDPATKAAIENQIDGFLKF